MDDAELVKLRQLRTSQLMAIVAGDSENSTRRVAAQDELAARAARPTRKIAFAALIVSLLSLGVSALAYFAPRSHGTAPVSSAAATQQK